MFQFSDAPSGAAHAGVGAVNTNHANKFGDLFFFTKQSDGYQMRMGIYGGNVGIGTTNPDAKLSITATGDGARVLHLGTERAWVFKQLGTGAGTALELTGADPNNNNKHFVINAAGNVGIGTGTTAPQAKLDVRGDIKLGSIGQLFATSGEENLRIVRGVVTMAIGGGTPVIAAGSGFQVTRNGGSGNFHISFNTPFAGQPAITAIPRESITGFVGFCMTDGVTSSGADIHIYLRVDGSFSDKHFEFIAVGPR